MNAWKTTYYHLSQSSFLILEKVLFYPEILHALRNDWNNKQYDKLKYKALSTPLLHLLFKVLEVHLYFKKDAMEQLLFLRCTIKKQYFLYK